MSLRRSGRSQGFTLLELLIAIALMVFLMGLVVQIFVTSTNVFNRAKAKTEIYQNARFAMDRLGKEINNCISTELLTQDFRLGWPVAGGATPPWYGTTSTTTTFGTDLDASGATVTAPYLVMVTSTNWIDTLGKQQIGTARVAYRIKRNSIPDALDTVSCTLERVLFTPEAYSSSDDPFSSSAAYASNRLVDSTGTRVPNIDYCQFIYFDSDLAHIAVQQFSTTSKSYVNAASGALTTFAALPPSLRIVMDVIDEKDREIRTLSRQFTIYAAR